MKSYFFQSRVVERLDFGEEEEAVRQIKNRQKGNDFLS